MLMDVGKLRLDPHVLQAARALSDEEAAHMHEHVAHGMQIVRESGMMNQDVLDIVAHHHERYDGSGYPQGLAGDEIPAVARIAAIVDTYDAVTSNRHHAPAISPANAIKMLYRSRNIDFQAELVEVFIQAVGIYPAGTIVELTTGEVGVVVSEYRTRRLKPKVMLLLDARKYPLREPKLVDLSEMKTDPDAPSLAIARALEPGAHDIDLSKLDI
jgi:HD-GYP domain-containing protein (c-di-GMP phosphodiesterase class II)